jgi:hypothetical protein
MPQQLQHAFVGFCVLYTVASFLSWLLQQLLQQRQRITSLISPRSGAIKPIDYRNEDLLLRKALTAVNWQLIANKANALRSIKAPTVKTSASFAVGTRRFSVPLNYSKKDCAL